MKADGYGVTFFLVYLIPLIVVLACLNVFGTQHATDAFVTEFFGIFAIFFIITVTFFTYFFYRCSFKKKAALW